MNATRLSSYFFLVILAVSFLAAIFIFLPFLTPLVLAAAAAVLVYPFYRQLILIAGNGRFRRTIAALITVVGVTVVILVPLSFLVGNMYAEIQSLYALLSDEGNRSQVVTALNNFSQDLSTMVFGVLPSYSFDSFNVTSYLKEGLQWAFANVDNLMTSLARVAGYILVFLLSLFYFLRDGVVFKEKVFSWSPLLEKNHHYIATTVKRAIRSVFAGTLVVAVLDGISIGVSFAVFGIPAPALWGTVAAVASLVPGFGIALVIIPGAFYFGLLSNYTSMFAILVWGYATVVLVDHIIGPSLVNTGVRIHPLAILLSVLGGIFMFGLVGFLIGPLILVTLFTLLEVYSKSTNE